MDRLQAAKAVAVIEKLIEAKLPSNVKSIREEHNAYIRRAKEELTDLLMEADDHA